jgi:hypothetical protein
MNTLETFTCVISSHNSVTANTANNCWIKLGGLPNDLEFYCEVIDFAINRTSLANIVDYIFLTVNEGFEIIGGVQFPKRFNKLCNINSVTGQHNGMFGNVFKVRNFNGRVVNFQLGDPDNTLVDNANINVVGNTFWTITLKMTPIKNTED